jgi:hypothetical protein
LTANLLAAAERRPTLVNGHNGHLQRNRSTMRIGGLPPEWWSAGAIVAARMGEEYAFLATALGTIRHQGVDTPPPDTVEGLLYALPQEHCLVDARRLATALADPTPVPRVSPGYGFAPLDPRTWGGTVSICGSAAWARPAATGPQPPHRTRQTLSARRS